MATDLVIRSVASAITTFSIPFARFGIIPVGGRTTAIKLQSGDVFVLVSSPLDAPTKQTVDAMGTVKYLLAPDLEHTINISAWSKDYPLAKCIGPAGIAEKKPDVKFAGVMGAGGEEVVYGFEDEIKLHYFPGHANKEIATLHMPSKTLLQADLFFNLPPTEQYSKTTQSSKAFWPASILQGKMTVANHDFLTKSVSKDKEQMKKDVAIVGAWDFERIIPCHGDVIETGGKGVWEKVFRAIM